MSDEVRFDWQRTLRSGIPEVVFGQGKSIAQLQVIAGEALERHQPILMTRVASEHASMLLATFGDDIDWNEKASTVIVGAHVKNKPVSEVAQVAIVAAGTSDHALVAETEQCLEFLGASSRNYMDVGVAGLWRLTDIAAQLRSHSIVIAVAGMEGALFSVVAGLVSGPVIALPSSVGYGVSADGQTALNCALASCAPGIAVVNIDNGFGAAALAVKMLGVGIDE